MEFQQLLQDIGAILAIRDIWDIFIYIIFFMSLVTLVLIPDKNMQSTMLMSLVLLFTVVDKVRPASPNNDFLVPGFDDQGFATFLIHIGMFVFPLIAGTLVRSRSQKGKRAMPLGILTGILGGLYAAAFFFSNGGLGDIPL